MIDPFVAQMNYDPSMPTGGFIPPASNYPAPMPTRDDMLLGPPVGTSGELPPPDDGRPNPAVYPGRFKHGRGLPPGQQRKMGSMAQQWQANGGVFEPGWRKQMRSMLQAGWNPNPQMFGDMRDYAGGAGGMQSANGGGYQAAPQGATRFADAYRQILMGGGMPQPYRSPGFQAQPQGGMVSWVPDQGMNQVAPQRQMVDRGAYFDPFVGPF